jgi:hypothetical protein
MSARDAKQRKRARKARNKYRRDHLLDGAAGNPHWSGSVSFRIGRHRDAVWRVTWSGVRIPVAAGDDLGCVLALTELAQTPDRDRN